MDPQLPMSQVQPETPPVVSPAPSSPQQKKMNPVRIAIALVLLLVIGISGVLVYLHMPASTTQRVSLTKQQNGEIQNPVQAVSPTVGVVRKATPLNLTALPLGDQKTTTTPKIGYVYLCRAQNQSNAGAFKTGNWINTTAKTWDATRKLTVSGSISWPLAKWSVTTSGSNRLLSGNGYPSHTTGIYPIQSSDPAYQYDRNPNSIKETLLSLTLPLNPVELSTPDCIGGEVGVMLTGIPLFNAFDAGGRDAMAYEVQDSCAGHPQEAGEYHYHGYSPCLKDTTADTEHSSLVGYAFDGFGIYGLRGEGGVELTTADLDECHGHTHEIVWNGKKVVMYHYHLTRDFPYSVSCFRGKKMVNGPLAGSNAIGQGIGQMPSGMPPLGAPSGTRGYPPPPQNQ